MPEGMTTLLDTGAPARTLPDTGLPALPALPAPCSLKLLDLQKGEPDAIGAIVREVIFRGMDYAIYRSERGVYVHFSDHPETERAQRAAYVKLSVQICELRYLTSQMRPSRLWSLVDRISGRTTLYDHNMGQALMLLMESVSQRRDNQEMADATEKEAKDIAQRALDMAVKRNTVDNTIRYVRTCVLFGITWLAIALLLFLCVANVGEWKNYVLASAAGIIGAIFSVIVRAQAFNLKPCDDSGMNKLMSLIRIGMGGIAGPALLLLLMTVSVNAMAGASDIMKNAVDKPDFIRMTVILGLIGGFAERLVPNLVQAAANKMDSEAGTPGQALQEAKTTSSKDGTKPNG